MKRSVLRHGRAQQKTYDLKRKASEALGVPQGKNQTHLPTSTPGRKHWSTTALRTLGHAVRDAAAATHSLTCGVPDRESNEIIKYLREATDLIEKWQQQLEEGQPATLATLQNAANRNQKPQVTAATESDNHKHTISNRKKPRSNHSG